MGVWKSLSQYHIGDLALGTMVEVWGSLREKLVLMKEGRGHSLSDL